MTFAHGGNLTRLARYTGKKREEILDFSASINPLGPPEAVRRVIGRNIEYLGHYPDPEARRLHEVIAADLGVAPENIVAGNGSTEIIYAIPRALGKKRAVIPIPSYHDYTAAGRLAGLEIAELPLQEANGFQLDVAALAAMLANGGDIVFLGQPNNPTATLADLAELQGLFSAFPDTFFVIDESFADFVPDYRSVTTLRSDNCIMLRSLTKFYAIPGLRLGYGCAAAKVASRLRALMLPWSLNTLAQEVGAAVLADRRYKERTLAELPLLRRELAQRLADLPGLTVYPSAANFLLLQSSRTAWPAARIAELLLDRGIVVRVCENFAGLPDQGRSFFRIAVRAAAENDQLAVALGEILGQQPGPRRPTRKKFSLMLQGTSSNAGKSVLTAALCRILLQDGLRIAPFKAQNMSLNSFVTSDGLEMGRAQVVQAQACRLLPNVRMNPILLKPSSDVGCQVIVNGRPVANMTVGEYIDYKPTAWQAVTRAYDELAAEYDGVLLEGAGSPGEVNLKHHDIVNMRMARYAGAPVLVVGDIDRGGVFASFVGTMEVLAEWERSLVAGFVVNRFRGQQSLLEDACRYAEMHTGRPVFGVVPYVTDLGLPEEDSVSFKDGLFDAPPPTGEHVVLGLVDLPHISNFTDFEPFRNEPDVHLRVIRSAPELAATKDRLAAVFLPGSKNVVNDLHYLRASGIAEIIRQLAATGKVEIVGLCGGLQMLGGAITDPHGLESTGASAKGLELLDIETTLALDKTLMHRVAVHEPSGLAVHGYEIHHGRSKVRQKNSGQDDKTGRVCIGTGNGMVWGSYLHGIFDADPFRRWFIDRQRIRRQLPLVGKVLSTYDLEACFNRLANVVRQGLDMERIHRLLGL